MKIQSTLIPFLGLILILAGTLELQAQNIAIYGETVHTMAKTAEGQWQDPIENGVVLIIDGKISADWETAADGSGWMSNRSD